MVSPVILKKENIKLPDFYTVTFYPINGNEPIVYEVAGHTYITFTTKYNQVKDTTTGRILNVLVEFGTQRAIELKLSNREYIIIGLDMGYLKFSKEFDEICELKKLQDEKKA